MTIELNPVGVTCNLQCPYCYEHPIRDAGNFSRGYDLERMKQGLLDEGVGKSDGQGGKVSFTLFGGEAMLMPYKDLVEICEWGYATAGKLGIQTNGTLIEDEHVELFKRCCVHVGMSVDGPDELNDSRWAGSLEKTRERTKASMDSIDKLCAAGIPPSLIITLYRGNGLPEPREKLKTWLRELDKKGVWSSRLHMLEVDHESVRENYALTSAESIEAVLDLANFQSELQRLRFDIFSDILKLLKGDDEYVSCVWSACDPYTTDAVRGIDGDGTSSNCGRAEKEGINWYKAPKSGHERQLALYNTPQEYNGCQGCRFFVMCKGECPGTGESTDWRNRSDMCETWKALFGLYEKKLVEVGIIPTSLHPKLAKIEEIMLQTWENGGNTNITRVEKYLKDGGSLSTWGSPSIRSDHTDATLHGDVPHGNSHADIPHGNHHGDSNRAAREIEGIAPVVA